MSLFDISCCGIPFYQTVSFFLFYTFQCTCMRLYFPKLITSFGKYSPMHVHWKVYNKKKLIVWYNGIPQHDYTVYMHRRKSVVLMSNNIMLLYLTASHRPWWGRRKMSLHWYRGHISTWKTVSCCWKVWSATYILIYIMLFTMSFDFKD